MTLETFLEKLEQTPRDWYLDRLGRIRRCGECPITSLTHRSCGYADDSALQLGMAYVLRDQIMVTADDYTGDRKFDAELRAKLLKACGLEAA